jgi:hypothetical protein
MLRFGRRTRSDASCRSGHRGRSRACFGLLRSCLLIWSTLLGNAAAGEPSVSGYTDQTAPPTGTDDGHQNQAAKAIVHCLKLSQEAILVSDDGVVCVPKRSAPKALKARGADLPQTINVKDVCEREQMAPGSDKRVLERMTIKRIAKIAAEETIDSSGIRVIGAIFCNGLELTGIDLPYSLVLDRSVIWGKDIEHPAALFGNIEARNMRIAGDFSIESSRVYGNIRLVRSDLAGSFFSNKTFANRIQVQDTTIKGG